MISITSRTIQLNMKYYVATWARAELVWIDLEKYVDGV